MEDAPKDSSPHQYRVEDGVVGSTLCSGFTFVVVLLITESDRNVFCETVKVWMVGGDGLVLPGGEEDDVADG